MKDRKSDGGMGVGRKKSMYTDNRRSLAELGCSQGCAHFRPSYGPDETGPGPAPADQKEIETLSSGGTPRSPEVQPRQGRNHNERDEHPPGSWCDWPISDEGPLTGWTAPARERLSRPRGSRLRSLTTSLREILALASPMVFKVTMGQSCGCLDPPRRTRVSWWTAI